MKKILILGVILLAACKPQSKTAHTIRHNNTLKQLPPYAPFDSCVGACLNSPKKRSVNAATNKNILICQNFNF